MKILHDPNSNLHLTKYGIQVPLADDRDFKVYDFLKSKGIPVTMNFTQQVTLTKEDLARVHNPVFLSKLYGSKEELRQEIIKTYELINEQGEYHRYDPQAAQAPLEELFDSVLLKTKGTMFAVAEALKKGAEFSFFGGFHHAMSFGGRGFCLINDVVIAARWSQKNHGTKTIWVIDVDAHKGDGTAELTQNDPTIKTLSIHMQEGWPLDSGAADSPWFIPSDVEIGIKAGEEASYLSRLKAGLLTLEKSGKPDLAIVVQGSDPYEKDCLPSANLLQLTKEQMLERDLLVYDFLRERSIPQAYVMAGGYGEHVYEIYCQFLEAVFKK
jgi:acetoin utilization deacetylase AcuC-like enzyme